MMPQATMVTSEPSRSTSATPTRKVDPSSWTTGVAGRESRM